MGWTTLLWPHNVVRKELILAIVHKLIVLTYITVFKSPVYVAWVV